jgi:hypothetical protein
MLRIYPKKLSPSIWILITLGDSGLRQIGRQVNPSFASCHFELIRRRLAG